MFTPGVIKATNSTRRYLFGRCLLAIIIAGVFLMGSISPTRAAYAQTITVVHRLVIWASPSFRSPVIAVLLTGRHFTATARSRSGRWIFGFTDMGMSGWISTFGFLQLHPEVNLRALSVMGASNSMMPMAPPVSMSSGVRGGGY